MTQTVTLGLASTTNTPQSLTKRKVRTLGQPSEIDLAQGLTALLPLAGSFASADDTTGYEGLIPLTGLTLANLETSEYAGTSIATLWYLWIAPSGTVPDNVHWEFSYAGQSGSGGASLRVWDNITALPTTTTGLATSDTGSGATDTLAVDLVPVAGHTYYVQVGLKEKAGTTSDLEQSLTWPDPSPSFTPVVP